MFFFMKSEINFSRPHPPPMLGVGDSHNSSLLQLLIKDSYWQLSTQKGVGLFDDRFLTTDF
jgi:hypothetical protein